MHCSPWKHFILRVYPLMEFYHACGDSKANGCFGSTEHLVVHLNQAQVVGSGMTLLIYTWIIHAWHTLTWSGWSQISPGGWAGGSADLLFGQIFIQKLHFISPMADPGFVRGLDTSYKGAGDNLLFWQILSQNCMKIKIFELGPLWILQCSN